MAIKVCNSCKDRDSCSGLCEEMEQYLNSGAKEDWRMVYVSEPRAQVDWKDSGIYEAKLAEEKSFLSLVLRPLFHVESRARLVYLAWYYFGMSVEDIGTVFKIKRRRVYDVLREAKDTLERVQNGEAVHQPRGVAGGSCCEQEDDLSEV